MANNESRVLDVFGPNFLIETNGAVGVAGQLKYQLYSVTAVSYTHLTLPTSDLV